MYILAKLNWNVPGLVATDFVDHILKVGAVLLLADEFFKQSPLIGCHVSLMHFHAIQFTRGGAQCVCFCNSSQIAIEVIILFRMWAGSGLSWL